MKLFYSAILAILLTACSSVERNAVQKVTEINEPPLNQVVTANIGEYLINKGLGIEYDGLTIYDNIGGALYQIPAGQYELIGTEDGQRYYSMVGVSLSAFADPIQALTVPLNSTNEVCAVTAFGTETCYDASFEEGRYFKIVDHSFQQTLLYSGKVGDILHFEYREFKNDRARPAFNHSVKYDISESKVIGYRGASLEVIEVNNSTITYKMLKTFK